MKQFIPSTSEIVLYKFLNRNINEKWVDWACDMLAAGFDSDNLRMLAAVRSPFIDSIELQRLANNVFIELNVDYSNKDVVVKKYACYLVIEALEKRLDSFQVLEKLKDLYFELSDEPILSEFYILWVMKDDELGGMVYEGKVDDRIHSYFLEWRNNNCIHQKLENGEK